MQPINLTVKQLNMYVRSLLEGDTNLASITLEGEISGFKNHFGSGHWYFVLKDADASVKSVMFKGNAQRVNFLPRDGMRVVCHGYVSLYEKDGQFQFYAETMHLFGEGDLAAEFERLKRKLESEGLFSLERKRPLPKFPKKIGVITSEIGAALQDILQVTSRRYPISDIVVFPALVQGISAPHSLVSALEKAYSRDDLDLIIIGRGGGSAEDLSCFNDELLARKIVLSPIPVISAVGHEVDFTICDFVSDLRAPTPSAAAELAVPSAEELLFNISSSMSKIE
ncbi:MAG: exodeoxyribonuclease VII large subunit, partial [Acutalibacteraceae bacterium]|nr:exodeoxyribonuclease VII large subunit [Acutalibacteraceae bacterium]